MRAASGQRVEEKRQRGSGFAAQAVLGVQTK